MNGKKMRRLYNCTPQRELTTLLELTLDNYRGQMLTIALSAPVSNLSRVRYLTLSLVHSRDNKSQRHKDCKQLGMRPLTGKCLAWNRWREK